MEILVDVREPDDTLKRVLTICPLAKREQLSVGDIAFKQVAIELKSWSDFITALTSKEDDRFRRQLYNFLINKDIDGYYIIYGDWSEINQYSNIGMTAVLGAIASIQARYGMRLSVVPSKDYAIYVALKIIEKTFDKKDVRPVTYRVGSDERAIDGIVAIGERVGSEDGIRLLEHFGTFKNVINATNKQMMEVHKIGDIKAKNLLKVINYDFKSKAEFEEAIDEEFSVIDVKKDKIENEPEPKKFIDADKEIVIDDLTEGKILIYNAIEKYRKDNRKPCPLNHLLSIIKFTGERIRTILKDLEMESRIFLVDKDLYEVY